MLSSRSAAYAPCLSTDRLFPLEAGSLRFSGPLDAAARFIEENQLLDAQLWSRFADQFRSNTDDHDLGWRCEYWGKLMRGGAATWAYTQNPALYHTLEEAVKQLLSAQEPCGRFSSYSREAEFQGWDLWGRKYVLLGLEYFHSICGDDALRGRILSAMIRHGDYILSHIGPAGQGKRDIRETSTHWEGLNSSSLLEPVVLLYNLTGKSRFLDFARYIVEQGGIRSANIFQMALEDQLDPWQYPVTKAYEMMSCFEGLLEYSRAAGVPKWGQAAVNFARRVMASDITVIGSAGTTHELFDHSRRGQVDPAFDGIMQETCVTVTWMKLCGQLLRYTGDPAFGDELERSAYNALPGAVNTGKVARDPRSPHGWLPFDSYSPLRAGRRGQAVGGCKEMADGTIYGCCAAIGAAGTGLLPFYALYRSREGAAVNLYLPGRGELATPGGQALAVHIETRYPVEQEVRLRLELERPETFCLDLRIPGWCRSPRASVNGEELTAGTGWLRLRRQWADGDTLLLTFPMELTLTRSDQLGEEVRGLPLFGVLRRGPVVMARDASLDASPAGPGLDEPLDIPSEQDGRVRAQAVPLTALPFPAQQAFDLALAGGEAVRLVDYASAGKDYDVRIAAWLPMR